MTTEKERRISEGLWNLIERLVPSFEDEDEDSVNDRQTNAFELASNILESPIAPAVEADVNHAGDLIKKKLIKNNPSPENALRFSNLYSRLLTQPVLSQKWAILYLFYQLSDSDKITPVSDQNFQKFGRDVVENREATHLSSPPRPHSKKEEKAFEEAFAQSGLSKPIETSQEEKRMGSLKPPQKREGLKSQSGSQVSPVEGSKDRKWLDENNVVQKEFINLNSALVAGKYINIDPSETSLLRDLPFTLQGLSSTCLSFTKASSLKLPTSIPLPIISLLHTLAEPSLLYQNLEAFAQSSEGGLLGQSLRAAVGNELRSYLALVSILEGQIKRTLSSLDETLPKEGIGKAGVTLKRCVVWTREATMGLRLLSVIAEESKNKIGGQLISLIHGFSTSHGDPMVGAFAERLLTPVTRPFYDMLRHWIYDGELSDPYHEFFVSEQGPNDTKETNEGQIRGGASSVWEDKYKVEERMIPSIITEPFAQKVFLIGKSLNFIRHSCGDTAWVQEYSKADSKELRYGDTETLEAWIDDAYKTTMERLMKLMTDKFHVFDHLRALKDYILLGQGDFIALLMESLAANLDRPAGAQYRHTLTAQLEHAIRGSNAQFDSPEVLRRLDARMLQLSYGEIGWDCFTLEYKIDAPVDVVVTEWGNRQYLKVFNFLWRIKRVEFALSTTWAKCMTGARGVLQSVNRSVAEAWKTTRGELAAMIHFIGQLQYYLLFEVIGKSWDKLQEAIRKDGCTLNDLIEAHGKFLTDVTHKGLLGGKKDYMASLHEILKIMLSFRDGVDGLYSWSVADFTRRQGSEMRGAAIECVTDDVFVEVKARLRGLGHRFRECISSLLGELAHQPDPDMRFLGVVMNFNDFYELTRPKRRATGQGPRTNLKKPGEAAS